MSTTANKKILIVEDEKHIAEGLKFNISRQGHDAMIAKNGTSAIRLWREWNPDLIVLDIMLPGIDGLSVLQSIRLEDEQIPILILSAKTALDDKVKGLSYGVDDYMTKPFELEEFLLRIDRMLKRVSLYKQDAQSDNRNSFIVPMIYEFGNNRIDFQKSVAFCKDAEITLTEQEVKLLKLFIVNKGKPLSRKKLLEIGWGYTSITSTRTIDNFIVRLRKYFEENPKKPVYFKSLRSVGYVFDHP
ncbi:MAG: DNA-binding response regulator [Desulfobacteraceae bacterium]|nr:MAG: DNA-binding response regulator [Desulfobacteraceae bacterium]